MNRFRKTKLIKNTHFIHLPLHQTSPKAASHTRSEPCQIHSNAKGAKPYDRIRRGVAEAAVELAFLRYPSQQEIPFDVIGTPPFADPDKYTGWTLPWRDISHMQSSVNAQGWSRRIRVCSNTTIQ